MGRPVTSHASTQRCLAHITGPRPAQPSQAAPSAFIQRQAIRGRADPRSSSLRQNVQPAVGRASRHSHKSHEGIERLTQRSAIDRAQDISTASTISSTETSSTSGLRSEGPMSDARQQAACASRAEVKLQKRCVKRAYSCEFCENEVQM